MRLSLGWVGAMLAACVLTLGCTQKPDPDQLRRETAQATSDVKQDAQAVVQGVREGLKSDKRLDLNGASRDELLDLPGVTAQRADKIIASRPFGGTNDLVTQHIVSEAEYDRIKDRIRVGKPSPSVQ